MAYVHPNFKTKKELKEAVNNGVAVTVFYPGIQPSGMFDKAECSVEGPHYPKPHSWSAKVKVSNGQVVKVIS